MKSVNIRFEWFVDDGSLVSRSIEGVDNANVMPCVNETVNAIELLGGELFQVILRPPCK